MTDKLRRLSHSLRQCDLQLVPVISIVGCGEERTAPFAVITTAVAAAAIDAVRKLTASYGDYLYILRDLYG